MDLDEFNVALSGTYRRLWLMAAALSGDRVQADDLVQETALIALRRRQQFRRGSNFTAWMAAILRFVVLNHSRRRSRRKTFAVDPVHLDRTMAAESISPTNLENTAESWRQLHDDQTEFDDIVLKGLKSLSPEARLCLLLSVVEELPYAEIAEMLEIPEGTVASHVHRAKRLLRDSLRPATWRKP